MKLNLAKVAATLSLPLVLWAGCEDKGIGGLCDLGINTMGMGAASEVLLNGAALECPSRVCIQAQPMPGVSTAEAYTGDKAVCSAPCTSDDDCSGGITAAKNTMGADRGLCHSGFVCAIATTTGPFCCEKLCICKDYFPLDSKMNAITYTPASCTEAARAAPGSACKK